MHPFAQLEKRAGAGRLIGQGIKSLWNSGAWKTLGKVTEKGIAHGGNVGKISQMAQPVAKAMSGRAGHVLGAYGLAGMAAPAFGVNLPGSHLAMNLGMPVLGAMNSASSAITAGRANTTAGRKAIQGDVETGASQAAQDFISGLHINPGVAGDADAYRNFSEQIGRGMTGADKYTSQGYKPITGFSAVQNLFEDPDKLIKNRIRQDIQARMPELLKGAGLGAAFGKVMKPFGHALTGLTVGGATLGLGNAVLGKTPHNVEDAQNEGYSAAQAAIQNRLRNMSSFERMAVKMDPTLAVNGIAQKFPAAFKAWEAKHGPLQRGMLASTVNAFQNPSAAKFYSTDAGGNKNFIN